MDKINIYYHISFFNYIHYLDCDCKLDDNSLYNIFYNMNRKNKYAACSFVLVDFDDKEWGFWNIYQNFQYSYG